MRYVYGASKPYVIIVTITELTDLVLGNVVNLTNGDDVSRCRYNTLILLKNMNTVANIKLT